MKRHKGIKWADVEARLETNNEKLWALDDMEATGGEPDVVGHDKKTGEYIFYDCSAESPNGRRSLCYDGEALASRKEHKPKDSAIDQALAGLTTGMVAALSSSKKECFAVVSCDRVF